MPLNGSSGTRLRSSNSITHFANLTPKKDRGPLFGWLGILRIATLIAEVLVTIVQPELAPLAAVTGASLQEAFDIYSFAREDKNRQTITSFVLSSLVNIIPAGLAVRGSLKQSKDVLRIVDETAENGFRYIIKGVDPEFSSAFARISSKESVPGISRITYNQQRALQLRGTIPTRRDIKKINPFERALQKEFGETQNVFSNKDLAILRRETDRLARGKTTDIQVWRELKELSNGAKSRYSRKAVLAKMKNVQNEWLNIINKQSAATEANFFRRSYRWWGTSASSNRKFYKSGRFWTQTAQLANPNDMAREILNKPTSWLLNGFKVSSKSNEWAFKWKGLRKVAQGWRKSIEKKFPKIAKIIKLPLNKKIFAKYQLIQKELSKHGVLSQDDEFLMGWRIVKKGKSYSEVIFYFNPMTTNAKTPGSINFGGKKAIHKTIRTSHLNYLAKTPTPGHAYLKGEGGFPPVALSPGGKRPVNFTVNNEYFEALTLVMELTPLRNILSVVSNFKNVTKDIIHGTYKARWKSTFIGTFKRLWTNKVTRILGHTIGNIISKEAGAHLSRLLKTTAQGFQRTKSKTSYINGRKVVTRTTSFSFSNGFNWRPLVKQGLPQTARSATVRRSPKNTTVRNQIKYKRYGTNLRRIPGIGLK